MQRAPRAFTLVELLVVIAILALLLALLSPSLSKARSLARKVSCQTNLRAIVLAAQDYATDHDGLLPWVWWCRRDLPCFYARYYVQMADYLALPHGFDVYANYIHYRSPYILMCPEVTGVLDEDRDGYRQAGSGYAYGANYVTMNGGWPEDGYYQHPHLLPFNKPDITLILNAEQTFAFNEANHFFPRPTPWEAFWRRNRFRHDDRETMNAAYFDGRVGTVRRDWMLGDEDWCDDWWPDHPFWAAMSRP